MISEHASPLAALGGVDAGGQNVYVAALSQELCRNGHEVTVYTRRDDPDLPLTARMPGGAEVVHVPAGPARPLPKDELEPYMGEFGRWLAARWTEDGRPDLVHAHFWMSGIAAMRATETIPIPVVQTFHALGAVKRRHQGGADTSPPDRLAVERDLAERVDLIIATCRDERNELLALGADAGRISVIPCGVDLSCFTPSPRTRPSGARPRVLALGRMVERKGVDVVIDAVASLPDVELVIAGGPPPAELRDDPEARRLQERIDRHGITDRARLIGRVDHEKTVREYANADVVACVPWYEPFGMVPLEAMACGRPVVGSAVGGLLDSIDAGTTGLLVAPHDADATASAIRRLVADTQLAQRMGAAGRDRVERLFGWSQVARLTEQAYAAVIARHATTHPDGRAGTRRRMIRHAAELSAAIRTLHETSSATIDGWAAMLADLLSSEGRLLAVGNGGSAAEAQHLTAELVGRFKDERMPLSALCLSAETSSLTAIVNDYGIDEMFARQVEAHGRSGDVLVALSTSGSSTNVLRAAERARERGLRVWAITGRAPNPLSCLADETVSVDSSDTSVIQEVHLLIVHALCAALDSRLVPPEAPPASAPATAPIAALRGNETRRDAARVAP
ncbi:glycosyltransferase [Cumulibacter manganitolerans]|uniref:glycosyltransferase n=1 Tax=Cumulibacter manganitolerans TaxID=1884992 RepID=UPI001E3C38D8|nr:glycosyltransferase [Cumulibacter manganitolerans]